MNEQKADGDLRLLLRLLSDARRYWPHIGVIFLLELLNTPLALLTPLPLKLVVDNVLGNQPTPPALSFVTSDAMLLFATTLFVSVAASSRLQAVASSLLSTYTGQRLTLDFRARLFRHMQRLSFSYHDTAGTTDSMYRIQYDAPAITWVAVHGVTPLITAAVTLMAMVVIVANIDLELALVALASAPVLVVLARISRRSLRRRWRHVKRLETASMSVIQEVLGNLRVVKGFGQEDREQERFVDASSTSLNAHIKVAAAEGLVGLLASLTTAVGTAVVIFIGVLHVQEGRLTLGDLILVIGYMAQLYGPLKTLSQSVATLQSSLASAERAYGVLDYAPDVPSRPDVRAVGRARGAVRFEDVTFGYRSGAPVLRRVSFDVAAGTRVGIQGTTGSGKTTLVSLLMRFYDPWDGQILLDGLDLRDYRLEDLRAQFAIVLQEPVLFSRTIAENIAYARPDATPDEILRAARLANADEFIRLLPEGYETVVGERGMTLSGGERQRISLARAFLKDAPILILDEPTSAVDLRTEARIVEAMERLMAGRTTFMIAHRLSTLASCDVRLEVRDGEVVGATIEGNGARPAPSIFERILETRRPLLHGLRRRP